MEQQWGWPRALLSLDPQDAALRAGGKGQKARVLCTESTEGVKPDVGGGRGSRAWPCVATLRPTWSCCWPLVEGQDTRGEAGWGAVVSRDQRDSGQPRGLEGTTFYFDTRVHTHLSHASLFFL